MSQVVYDEQRSIWLLEMESSCYAMDLAGRGGLPRHLHWGRRVDLEVVGEMAEEDEGLGAAESVVWAEADRLEHLGWGGRRYDEPTVKVDLPDGSRGPGWHYLGHGVEQRGTATTLTHQLVDLTGSLDLEVCYRVHDSSDVLERWCRIARRAGDGSAVVRQAHSASWWLPSRPSWRLTYLRGGWASESQLARTSLGAHKVVLESRRGATGHALAPWVALDDGAASERAGEVWSIAVAWSGSWKIVLEPGPSGGVHCSGGWNDFDCPLELAAGQELVLPVVAGCYSSAGMGAASRAWHDHELRDVLPRSRARHVAGSVAGDAATVARDPISRGRSLEDLPALRPVLYNSWEATGFAVDEEREIGLAELAARIGVELFVLDDGWFDGRRDDGAALGDWTVDPRKFPRGLGPLLGRVRELGMRFGLWLEPEMVSPASELYRAHPDWVLHFPGRPRSQQRHQLVLNLAREDVASFVFETVDRLLGSDDISYLKWDLNRNVAEPGWPSEVGHNPERVWVDYVQNFYSVLDALREAHPRVEIESCSGGGGRVDLGVLSRVEQVWPSDNTDAFDRLAVQEGFTHAYAPITMSSWVTDSPNPLTGRRLSLEYRFHVAMAGVLGIGGDLTRWSAAELDEATGHVASYKSFRSVVQHGRLHRLSSPSERRWGAVQYVGRDCADVVVIACSGPCRYPAEPGRLCLVGLEPEATYAVVRDVDGTTGQRRRGATLMERGLELPRGLGFESLLVHLRRVDGLA